MSGVPNLEVLNDIGGCLVTKQFYKWDSNDQICDLDEDDYNRIITKAHNIKVIFPLGINGIVSKVYNYNKPGPITLRILIEIINNFYNSKITKNQLKIIEEQGGLSDEQLASFSKRLDLVKLTNNIFFQGLDLENDVYNISLGS